MPSNSSRAARDPNLVLSVTGAIPEQAGVGARCHHLFGDELAREAMRLVDEGTLSLADLLLSAIDFVSIVAPKMERKWVSEALMCNFDLPDLECCVFLYEFEAAVADPPSFLANPIG